MMLFFANHLYFLSGLYFTFFWVLFFLNTENKKKMILVSLSGLVFGPLVEFMHLIDWWQPHFLFNTIIKVEDLFFGFSISGISMAVFTILASGKAMKRHHCSLLSKVSLIIVILFILFGTFLFFNLSSFWSSIFTFTFGVLVICYWEPELFFLFLLAGGFLLLLSIPGYLFGIYINPNWVQQEWLVSKLSGIFIYNIPIEEFVWFFFAGMGIPAIYRLLFK